MDLIHTRCAGIDISKRDAKVCVRPGAPGRQGPLHGDHVDLDDQPDPGAAPAPRRRGRHPRRHGRPATTGSRSTSCSRTGPSS